ncbi:hypothetical protein ACGFYA_25810 [Streptomyces sp. NPDC048305]
MTPAAGGSRWITGRVLAETSDLADLRSALRAGELLDGSGDMDSMKE